jgi:hypothetical protein
MEYLDTEVVPVDRWLECGRCGHAGEPTFSRSGPHIRADCGGCGRYIRFVKQVKDHPIETAPSLYGINPKDAERN